MSALFLRWILLSVMAAHCLCCDDNIGAASNWRKSYDFDICLTPNKVARLNERIKISCEIRENAKSQTAKLIQILHKIQLEDGTHESAIIDPTFANSTNAVLIIENAAVNHSGKFGCIYDGRRGMSIVKDFCVVAAPPKPRIKAMWLNGEYFQTEILNWKSQTDNECSFHCSGSREFHDFIMKYRDRRTNNAWVECNAPNSSCTCNATTGKCEWGMVRPSSNFDLVQLNATLCYCGSICTTTSMDIDRSQVVQPNPVTKLEFRIKFRNDAASFGEGAISFAFFGVPTKLNNFPNNLKFNINISDCNSEQSKLIHRFSGIHNSSLTFTSERFKPNSRYCASVTAQLLDGTGHLSEVTRVNVTSPPLSPCKNQVIHAVHIHNSVIAVLAMNRSSECVKDRVVTEIVVKLQNNKLQMESKNSANARNSEAKIAANEPNFTPLCDGAEVIHLKLQLFTNLSQKLPCENANVDNIDWKLIDNNNHFKRLHTCRINCQQPEQILSIYIILLPISILLIILVVLISIKRNSSYRYFMVSIILQRYFIAVPPAEDYGPDPNFYSAELGRKLEKSDVTQITCDTDLLNGDYKSSSRNESIDTASALIEQQSQYYLPKNL